ncbi:MAG: alpha/beta fold hydrolase [Pseudomonadota bacterium]
MTFSFLEKTKFWIGGAVLAALLATWFGAPGTVYALFLGAERQLAGLQQRSIELGAERWVYLDSEQSEREVLLLLHGFGADKDNYNRLVRSLDDRFRVVVPDLLGFGASSSALDNRYSAEAQAARVLEFLDAVKIPRAHVGGNSMGGYIALALAQQAPERVTSLWLMAPGGVQTPPLSLYVESIVAGEANQLIPASEADFEAMLDLVFNQPPWLPGPVVGYLARQQVARQDRLTAIFDGMAYQSRPAEEIALGVTVPTLISWGAQDRVLHPAGGLTLEKVMPQAEYVVLDGIGHLPQIEAPQQMASDYLSWLDRQRSALPSPGPDREPG